MGGSVSKPLKDIGLGAGHWVKNLAQFAGSGGEGLYRIGQGIATSDSEDITQGLGMPFKRFADLALATGGEKDLQTPYEKRSKKARDAYSEQQGQKNLAAARAAQDEAARVEALPDNVRRRAGQAASSLGLTGSKRPSASSYLSGVSP